MFLKRGIVMFAGLLFGLNASASSINNYDNTNRVQHKIVNPKNIVGRSYLDNLEKGWHLIGVEHDIKDINETFRNIDLVWMYKNAKWYAYSSFNSIKSKISNAGLSSFDKIDSFSGIWVYKTVNLPKISVFDINVTEKNTFSAKTELSFKFDNIQDVNSLNKVVLYDNSIPKEISANEGLNIYDFNLTGGYHKLKLCINPSYNLKKYEVCMNKEIAIDLPLDSDKYSNKIELNYKSNALSTDSKVLYTIDRDSKYVYSYDFSSKENKKLFRINIYPNSIDYNNGYLYIGSRQGYIYKYDLDGNFIDKRSVSFPDGITVKDDLIYSVKNDRDGKLLVLNADTFEKVGYLDTEVSDICGLTSDDKYIYVLEESGDIYRVDPNSKETIKVFNNQQFLRDNNSNGGVEGITILDGYIWVSYTNNEAIYKIDINLN